MEFQENQYRANMFNGHLYMPKIKKIKQIYGEKVYAEIQFMFEAMWYAYLRQGESGTISLPYWAKRIHNPKAMNITLRLLSKKGWIKSVSLPGNNWGEASLMESKLLEYLDATELASIRKSFKFSKYLLRDEDEATKNNRTRLNGKVKNTGLVREGFRKSSNTKFEFDIQTMEYYQDEVIKLVNKGIDKMMVKYPSIADDLAHYGNIGQEIVEHYIWNSDEYSAGQNEIDSRGRNISGMLNKIGNPIGFKIMRSLLVLPKRHRNIATQSGLRNKYLFIAELLGYKKGNVQGKVNFGRKAYLTRKNLSDFNLDDLYEYIWLERLYKDIDKVLDIKHWKKQAAMAKYRIGSITMTECAKKIETFSGKKWKVPVEIDMSASVLGIMGLLLDHKPFLDRTNMIGSTLNDAWGHDVITNRLQFKTIMRVCYGSSMSPEDMWRDMDIPFTANEAYAFKDTLNNGELAIADKFKDFLIRNSNMKINMDVKIGNEEFKIECNKWYHIGETTNKFDLYDTYTNSIRRIHNTETVKRPDLRRFKVYNPTLLIHNLDSQVEDNTTDKVYEAYEWVIDIHDALVLDTEAVDYAKDVYCSGTTKEEPSLEWINQNRNQILSRFFTSIGIHPSKILEWNKIVRPLIERYDKKLKINRIVLK